VRHAPTKQQRDFAVELVQIKAKAGSLGLFRTMHALDKATNAVGWELADMLAEAERSKEGAE
jgi:hypothetical protein